MIHKMLGDLALASRPRYGKRSPPAVSLDDFSPEEINNAILAALQETGFRRFE